MAHSDLNTPWPELCDIGGGGGGGGGGSTDIPGIIGAAEESLPLPPWPPPVLPPSHQDAVEPSGDIGHCQHPVDMRSLSAIWVGRKMYLVVFVPWQDVGGNDSK